MSKIAAVGILTANITDWYKWRQHAIDLLREDKRAGKACVRVSLNEMRATGYDWARNYRDILPSEWKSPDSLFICVNAQGVETSRWYMGEKITNYPDVEQAHKLVNPWADYSESPFDQAMKEWHPSEPTKKTKAKVVKAHPSRLWWEVERAAEKQQKEALIALRNEVRKLVGR